MKKINDMIQIIEMIEMKEMNENHRNEGSGISKEALLIPVI